MSQALPDSSSASRGTTVSQASSPHAAGISPGCVDSTDILRGQKTVKIKHNGSTYRLQATRLGKLILTK
jgi:hemin uptake protein HemP